MQTKAKTKTKEKGEAVRLEILFDKSLNLCGLPYRWRELYSKDVYDDVAVEKDKIVITYSRSSSAGKGRAFNRTRIAYIQLAMLALCSCEAVVDEPRLISATYALNGKRAEDIALPDDLTSLEINWLGTRFPETAVKRSFGDSWLAKSIRIAISYRWASLRAFSQEERLKLLWGSFNALYREYARYKNPSARRLFEQDMLDYMNNLFLERNVLNRALRVFDEEIEPLGYKEFVQWRILAGPRCKALFVKDSGDKTSNQAKRLGLLDKETLMNMRDCGCKDYKTKAELRIAIDGRLKTGVAPANPIRKVSMLLCRYIYIFRCDGVHANTVYPVFKSRGDEERRVLADLLEAAVTDLMEWFADNIA